MQTALETHHVWHSYDGHTWAVQDLHIHVKWGEIVGLLGPNGSGKSTTFHMITGLLTPSKGRIQIGTFFLDESPKEAKALIGFAPEYLHPLSHLTGWEYVFLVGALYGLSKAQILERATTLFSLFGLEASCHHQMETYSQGMLRKTILIAALVHRPRILIVDEPTNGLDTESFLLLKRLLLRMREHGHSIILATHQLNLAQDLCDRVYLLHQGVCFAEGNILTLLNRYEVDSLEDIFLKEIVEKQKLERVDELVIFM